MNAKLHREGGRAIPRPHDPGLPKLHTVTFSHVPGPIAARLRRALASSSKPHEIGALILARGLEAVEL